jgi:hypothetical protein
VNTYDINEAAQIAKVHKDTLRKMAQQFKDPNRPPGTKIGRAWIFPCHLFDRWIEEQCLSTNQKIQSTGGSASQSLASRLAKRRAQQLEKTQKSSSNENESASGGSTN